MSSKRRPRQARSVRPRYRVVELCGSAAGGVRSHVAQCARLLAHEGHDVIVGAPTSVLRGLDLGEARSQPVSIGTRPSLRDVLAVSRVRRLGRSSDVVHAHGLRAGAVAALALGPRRRGRVRLVVTLHNKTVGAPLTVWLGAVLERVVARRADRVLVVSPDLLGPARQGGAWAALAVVPAPQPHCLPGPAAPAHAWEQDSLRVLTVARLAPQKGLDLLLDTAALLAGSGGVEWLVAGDGPDRDRAQERIDAEGLPVRLLGHRTDVLALMDRAQVVVQTSLWEGQPLTIQEALRAGAAIVATDVGGTAETARGGAVLVPPDAQAVAGALTQMRDEPAALSRARRSAREAAARLPGPEALMVQLREVLLD